MIFGNSVTYYPILLNSSPILLVELPVGMLFNFLLRGSILLEASYPFLYIRLPSKVFIAYDEEQRDSSF